MTTKEQETIDKLYQLMNQVNEQNRIFRETVQNQISELKTKVEQKELPLSLEKTLQNSINDVVTQSLKTALTGYNSPMSKYADNAISKYQTSIEKIFDDILKENIFNEEFKVIAKEVLVQKVIKSIISGLDGGLDKVINKLKQDEIYRSKLTLFVNNLVTEFLNNQK